jgi:hypothetical protein
MLNPGCGTPAGQRAFQGRIGIREGGPAAAENARSMHERVFSRHSLVPALRRFCARELRAREQH